MSEEISPSTSNERIVTSRLVLNTLETVASVGGNLVINLLTGIVINRGLGPEGKGIYAGITTWVTILAWICNISFHQVTVYYFRKMPDKTSTIFTTFTSVSFVLGLFAAFVGEVLICPFLVRRDHLYNLLAVRCLFATIPLSTVVHVVNGALNGLLRFRFTNATRIAMPFTSLLIWIYLYFSKSMTATTCLIGLIVVTVVYGVTGIIYAGRLRLFNRRIDFRLIGPALAYGLKVHGATTADVVSGNVTQVLLSVMLPPVLLGYYSTAQSAAGALSVFSMAVTLTGFPVLSSLAREETHITAMKMWRVTLVVSVPAAVFAAVCFPWIIPLVFGKAFTGAVTCSVTMLLSVILSGQAGIIRNALNGRGYTTISSTSEGVAVAVSLGGIVFLPHVFGVEGVAIAAVLGAIARILTLLTSYHWNVGPVHINEILPHLSDVQWCFRTFISMVQREGVAAKDKLMVRAEADNCIG